MIIKTLDENKYSHENFLKLNKRAMAIELALSNMSLDEKFTITILTRIDELFFIYTQKANDKSMQENLFILEVAIHELCMVLEKVISE